MEAELIRLIRALIDRNADVLLDDDVCGDDARRNAEDIRKIRDAVAKLPR